eukprot:TRINITY_DN86_c0_g1_i4.p1 TRINITY_DN86_c0_g1~~TRINITY_DN86_c0_g1_i4.p1  ORF type:complete len:361 (-),score=126.20 TRINITY_DN86_c0_g1_i4:896-1978(-)
MTSANSFVNVPGTFSVSNGSTVAMYVGALRAGSVSVSGGSGATSLLVDASKRAAMANSSVCTVAGDLVVRNSSVSTTIYAGKVAVGGSVRAETSATLRVYTARLDVGSSVSDSLSVIGTSSGMLIDGRVSSWYLPAAASASSTDLAANISGGLTIQGTSATLTMYLASLDVGGSALIESTSATANMYAPMQGTRASFGGNFAMQSGSRMYLYSDPSSGVGFVMSVAGNFLLGTGTTISGVGGGFGNSSGPGSLSASRYGGAGAGHGGEGGGSYDTGVGGRSADAPAVGGLAYGSFTEPTRSGSGGSNAFSLNCPTQFAAERQRRQRGVAFELPDSIRWRRCRRLGAAARCRRFGERVRHD